MPISGRVSAFIKVNAVKRFGSIVQEKEVTYRPEIDGLRAIAIIVVLFYHAAFGFLGRHDWFARGDIGVDVFFVISGYLITTLILKELRESGSFDFANFYDRRARRIMPVLFVVILAFFPVAFHTLASTELASYLESIISTVFFGSNFYFYHEIGEYYPDSSAVGPFIHTWSLAIEEQFYLVFPLILLVSVRYFPRYTLSIFIVLFLLSLQFAEFIGETHPVFNYFLLVSRFWELLAGAILAYLEIEYGRVRHRVLNAVMPVVGCFMILWFLLLFDDSPVHPGFSTSIPVLGTAFIIAFSTGEDLVGRILRTPPFVAIGKISYSLYLWHMPVFIFFNELWPHPSNMDRVGWIVLSITLATASYFLVEQPFRNRKFISQKPLVIFLALMAVFIVSLSLFGRPDTVVLKSEAS